MTRDAAVLRDGDYTYYYGTEHAPGRMTFAHVARERSGEEPREYWTGTTWSADPGRSARVISGVGVTFAVRRTESVYVLVTREHNLPANSQMTAYTALSPTGPFDGPHYLGTLPEVITLGEENGKLIISDAGRIEHGWPLRPRATTPPAPRDLTVTAADSHAYLTWGPVAHSTAYRVYQRDVTGGQTHFARQPVAADKSIIRIKQLIPGHQYEFRVATVRGLSEGPLSDIVAATPHITRPTADVVMFAGTPDTIADSYLMTLQPGVVRPENLERFLGELLAQYGGSLTDVFRSISGCAFTMTEAGARDLAAHPDVSGIEQNLYFDLDA